MKSILLKSVFLELFSLAFVPFSFAHEGHMKAPGEEGATQSKGPIAISAVAKANLGLKVEDADLRTLEKTLLVIGRIEGIPKRMAAISSRIPGKVTELKVTEGELVEKGQAVVEVESRQVGDPPPRALLTSPVKGIVMERHVFLGNSVEPNQHLLEIGDLSEVYAEGQLFEGQIAQVKLGQKVRVYVESYRDQIFEGTVDLTSGMLDEENRTLKIWVRIANPGLILRPNMRAQLRIVTDEADTVIAVPRSAVLGEAGELFVFVQSDENDLEYERRAVVIGMKDDRFIEINEGVFPGDKVVTVGNYQLQYVTTLAADKKVEEEEHSHAEEGEHSHAVEEEHSHVEEEGHSHASADEHSHGGDEGGIFTGIDWSSPGTLMGVGLGVMLFLNAVIMLFKRQPRHSGGTN